MAVKGSMKVPGDVDHFHIMKIMCKEYELAEKFCPELLGQ
jgi:hypothetical protein